MKLSRIIESESFQQRLEKMYEYQDKTKHWPNVIAVLTRPEGNDLVKEWKLTNNIVTTAGDQFYAQKAAGQTPTNDFTGTGTGRFELRTGTVTTPAKSDTYAQVTTPVTASRQAIVTNRCSWTTTSFSGTYMLGGCIHSGGSGLPSGGATPLLAHWNFQSPVTKTTSDTLKVIVNHAMAGQP